MITALVLNVLVCGALALAMAFASNLLGPKKPMGANKAMPFETGMAPFEPAFGKMTATYHRYAVLFVVFDVDLAFLVPFILLRPEVSRAELLTLTGFVTLVALTLAVVWRQGALNCD
ncbi:MAG: NADH-quinone oxidoreductase subunit A [Elusimicrobia bacterium]|nr:NADH-quinone oxidoreductase subunit A [Elusimicrobiota bacterium]